MEQINIMTKRYKKEKETNREILELNMEIMANHQKQIDIIVFNNEQHQALQDQLEKMVAEQEEMMKKRDQAEDEFEKKTKECEKVKKQLKASDQKVEELLKENVELKREMKSMRKRDLPQKNIITRMNETDSVPTLS